MGTAVGNVIGGVRIGSQTAALPSRSHGLLFGTRQIGLQNDDRKRKHELARDLPKRPEAEFAGIYA